MPAVAERIFDLPLDELRGRASMKWRAHPDDVLPVWVAEMDARPIPQVIDAVTDSLTRGETGYPAGPVYEEAWADYAAEHWQWRPDTRAMRLAPDVMQGIAVVLAHLTTPGDRVMVNSPVYPPFFSAVTDRQCTIVDVPLNDEGRLDLEAIARSYVADQPRVHLLCSPHNPTGVVHPRDELTELARLARQHGVRVLVDEIHAPLVQAGTRFVPWLSVDDTELDVVVVSAAKGWNLASLKAGLIIGGSTTTVDALPYAPTRGAASHTAVIAHVAAVTQAPQWPSRVMTEVAENQQLLSDLLAEHLPRVSYRPGPGTYLAWLDARDTGWADPAAHWLARGRVALNAGASFGGERYTGHARINLATSPEILREAVRRMAAAR